MSSSPSAEGLPAVDERLVAPDSGYEILDGKVVEVPGCDEPHGTRQAKLAALLEACVTDDYAVAVDMLTRTSKIDDFAPDASVFPRARDPKTGRRRLEELAFEVLSTQSDSEQRNGGGPRDGFAGVGGGSRMLPPSRLTLGEVETKARKLAHRGVRRVLAIDIRRNRVWEWVRDADTWQLLHDAALIEDRCLAAPIAVEELVNASRADDAIARALLARRHPVIEAAIAEGGEEGRRQGHDEGRRQGHDEGRRQGHDEGRRQGHDEGRRQGHDEGRRQGHDEGELLQARRALLAIADARGIAFTQAQLARIDASSDLAQLETWLRQAATTDDPADILDG